MKRPNYIIIFALLFVCLSFGQNSEKVLFVGNSFTYYYNIPVVVEEMAKANNVNLEVYQSTLGGATLKQHYNGERDLKTLAIINKNEFDKVVLQDHSTYPLTHKDTSYAYFKKFTELIKSQSDAKPYLYATWMYPQLEQTEYKPRYPIESMIQRFADKTNSEVLPVGRAFKVFRERYPDVPVFMDDDKHANHNGAYLAACVIYGKLTGKSPLGLPHYFKSDEANGEKAIYYVILRNNIAQLCQQVAEEVLNAID